MTEDISKHDDAETSANGSSAYTQTEQRTDIDNHLSTGENYYQNWLEQQTDLIPGAYSAVLVEKDNHNVFQPVAVWPGYHAGMEALLELIEQSIEQNTAMITQVESAQDNTTFAAAFPVSVNDEIRAVTAVGVALNNESELRQVMEQLEWGAAWIELNITRQTLIQEETSRKHLRAAVELFGKVLPTDSDDSAALRLVSEASLHTQASLAGIGALKRGAIKLKHLSNGAQFDKKMNLVKALEAAMDEACDQQATLIYPPLQDEPEFHGRVVVAQKALSELQGGETILTVPLVYQDKCIGALCIQRDGEQPFSADEARFCESMFSLSSAVLEEKRLNNRGLLSTIKDHGAAHLAKLFGAGHLKRKLAVVLIAGFAASLYTTKGDYRLSTDARLSPAYQRVITAPFDSYIENAPVRAGDIVEKQQLLVSFEKQEKELERLRWLSQKNTLEQEYQEATALYDRAQIRILSAQLEKVQAQIDLVDNEILRTQHLSPFAGIIVKGDLSQRIGSSVSKGEVLFELAPIDAYRVELLVKENRINDVSVGQSGVLYLSALPHNPIEFEVSKITPEYVAKEGTTFFKVEANLDSSNLPIRPGMEGVGKVYIDQRRLISIWTREFLEWLRLKMWAFWG